MPTHVKCLYVAAQCSLGFYFKDVDRLYVFSKQRTVTTTPLYAAQWCSNASTSHSWLGNMHISQTEAAALPAPSRGVGAKHRGGGSCRACIFSLLQGFAFHSPVGLIPPPGLRRTCRKEECIVKACCRDADRLSYFIFWPRSPRKKLLHTGLLNLCSGPEMYTSAWWPLSQTLERSWWGEKEETTKHRAENLQQNICMCVSVYVHVGAYVSQYVM